jgi:hypothetical protein
LVYPPNGLDGLSGPPKYGDQADDDDDHDGGQDQDHDNDSKDSVSEMRVHLTKLTFALNR